MYKSKESWTKSQIPSCPNPFAAGNFLPACTLKRRIFATSKRLVAPKALILYVLHLPGVSSFWGIPQVYKIKLASECLNREVSAGSVTAQSTGMLVSSAFPGPQQEKADVRPDASDTHHLQGRKRFFVFLLTLESRCLDCHTEALQQQGECN